MLILELAADADNAGTPTRTAAETGAPHPNGTAGNGSRNSALLS